jgi:hypothetical protein
VRITTKVVELHGARAILEDALLADRSDRRRLRGASERVRLKRMRTARDVAEERDVSRVSQDREPFRDRRAHAPRVVMVVMRVHRVPERLAGPQLARLGDDSKGARIVLRSLDEHEILVELDKHAMVRPPCEVPDARSELL